MGRVLLALLALASAAQAEPTHYPLSLQNCGHTITFDGPPHNVVSIGQAATEELFALGLADHMAGTALWFNAVLPAYAEANARITRLADNSPSFESVMGTRPGLVAAQFEWSVGAQGVVATREQFAALGVPVYVLPADCLGKDNAVGGDGTRTAPFTTDTIWQSLTELGAIFDQQDEAAKLVATLRAREAAAIDRAQAMQLDASAVVWFSSPALRADPFVAGRKGVPAYMLSALSLQNIVTSDEEWPTVGWERIARANPSVIVLARMDRRRFPADDVDRKLDFLRTDPVTRQMEAVRQGRIVILDAQAMEASIRLVDGLETLAAALAALPRPPGGSE